MGKEITLQDLYELILGVNRRLDSLERKMDDRFDALEKQIEVVANRTEEIHRRLEKVEHTTAK